MDCGKTKSIAAHSNGATVAEVLIREEFVRVNELGLEYTLPARMVDGI